MTLALTAVGGTHVRRHLRRPAANLDVDGRVESVRVLRSVKVLDDLAIAAVKQRRDKPLTLNVSIQKE